MTQSRLPIPMFRLGQYSFTTPRLYLSESKIMMTLSTIKNLDEPLLELASIQARISIPGSEPFMIKISGVSETISRRCIITSIRSGVRDHYLSARSINALVNLPLIDRLVVDEIHVLPEANMLLATISDIPATQHVLPPGPGF